MLGLPLSGSYTLFTAGHNGSKKYFKTDTYISFTGPWGTPDQSAECYIYICGSFYLLFGQFGSGFSQKGLPKRIFETKI